MKETTKITATKTKRKLPGAKKIEASKTSKQNKPLKPNKSPRSAKPKPLPGGRALRQHDRENKKLAFGSRMAKLFEGLCIKENLHPQALPLQMTVEQYSIHMHAMKLAIAHSGQALAEQFRMRRLLTDMSLDLINRYRLNADPVAPPISITRSESWRHDTSLGQLRRLRLWVAAFEDKLLNLPKFRPVESKIWLGLALFSAIARGQLCEPTMIKALLERLLLRVPLLEPTLGEPTFGAPTLASIHAIRLSTAVGPIANMHEYGKHVRVYYWTPDSLSLSLIERWLNADSSDLSPQDPMSLIEHALNQDGRLPAFASLASLCSHTIWLTDDRPGFGLSEALCQVVQGRWTALGLDDVGHALLLGHYGVPVDDNAPPWKPDITATQEASRGDLPTVYSGRLDELQDIMGLSRKRANPSEVADIDTRNETQARTALIADLQILKLRCHVDMIEHLLICWYLRLLEHGKRLKVISVRTYHARIAARLVDAVAERPLSSLTASDFDGLYQRIVADVPITITRRYVAGTLQQLHRFGIYSEEHRLPDGVEPLASNGAVMLIRARTIPHTKLADIEAAIKTLCPDHGLATVVCLAVRVAYRAGLRRGEITKLRLCDVEPSPEHTLFIVENHLGPNKTGAARRQIPLAALLRPDELRPLTHFIRAKRQGGDVSAQLFGDPNKLIPLSADWLGQIVARAMGQALGGSGWSFHHLRHTAMNNMFLVLENETALAAQLSGWSPAQQEDIRAAIVGDPGARQKRYYALAAFAGHASPRQTFESYIHLWPTVLAAKRGRLSIATDRRLIAHATGAPVARLEAYETDAAMHLAMIKRMKHWRINAPIVQAPSRHQQRTIPKPGYTRPSPEACWNALLKIEGGSRIEAVAAEADLDPALVTQWVERAKALAALKTKYGKHRLFAAERVARAEHDLNRHLLLLPTRFDEKRDQGDADILIAHLRRLHEKAPNKSENDTLWWINHVITHADPSNSGTPFREPADMKRFLAIVLGSKTPASLPAHRWRLSLTLPPVATADKTAELWHKDLPEGLKYGTRSYPQSASVKKPPPLSRKPSVRKPWARGHARLHLIHAPKSAKASKQQKPKASVGIIRSTYTSGQAVRYVAHLLAIMTGAVKGGADG